MQRENGRDRCEIGVGSVEIAPRSTHASSSGGEAAGKGPVCGSGEGGRCSPALTSTRPPPAPSAPGRSAWRRRRWRSSAARAAASGSSRSTCSTPDPMAAPSLLAGSWPGEGEGEREREGQGSWLWRALPWLGSGLG